MSCGCPVITTKEGSLREIAGDAAFFVDPFDVESISNGIKTVLSDDELGKKLRYKGLEQAKKFSWEKTASETRRVYEKVLEK